MYTPVLFIPKVALEDTTIPAHTATPGQTPEPTEVFVPKGTRVAVLSSALHYNRESSRIAIGRDLEADDLR